MKTLIIGAGSIGNHLAQAARALDWDVTVSDRDPSALTRMQEDIYPTRYGAWDSAIELVESDENLPKGDFDIIAIGTPPDSHMSLSLQALERKPRLLHIEKPLFTPLDNLLGFERVIGGVADTTYVTVGYDHAVAPSVFFALDLIRDGAIGEVLAVQSRTLEHWAGIFGAHPWLEGPHDSYLGFWRRGGGALSEHSHALHLGLAAATAAGWPECELVSYSQNKVRGGKGEDYDQLTTLLMTAGRDRYLTVTQDVITKPTEKAFRVIGKEGVLDVALSGNLDVVTLHLGGDEDVVRSFEKSRPDDFLALMKHYRALLSGEAEYEVSPVHIKTGLAVMRVIQEVFESS